MLLKLAKAAFDAASWPTTIQTGRYMYPLADNIRNVANVNDTPTQLKMQNGYGRSDRDSQL